MAEQDIAQFQSIIAAFLSDDDNARRQRAEAGLKELKTTNPALFFQMVLTVLQSADNVEARQLCAILFKNAVQPTSDLWTKISPEVKQEVQRAIFACLRSESSRVPFLSICDAIGTLGSRVIPNGQWDSLLDDLFKITQEDGLPPPVQMLRQEGFLRCIDSLSEYAIEYVKANLDAVLTIIMGVLTEQAKETPSESTTASVAIAAFRAFVSICMGFVQQKSSTPPPGASGANAGTMAAAAATASALGTNIDRNSAQYKQEMQKLEQMCTAAIPAGLAVLASASTQGDDATVVSLLNSFTYLISRYPHLFVTNEERIQYLLQILMPIAQSPRAEWDTRQVAFEVLVSLSINGRGTLRGCKPYVESVIRQSFMFLREYDYSDDAAWSDPNNDEDQDTFIYGCTCIERLSHNFGGRLFMQVAGPLIYEGLSENSNWQTVHVTLWALQNIFDNVRGFFTEQRDDGSYPFNELIQILLNRVYAGPQFGKSHKRIRFALLAVLIECCHSLEDEFAQTYGFEVLGVVADTLQNFRSEHPRVIRQAAKLLSHFNEFCTEDILVRVSDPILNALAQVLEAIQESQVQESCVTGIATCANVLRGQFARYYDLFMPKIKQILFSATSEEHGLLRGKAMECVGIMGKVVGPDKFGADAREVIEFCLSIREELSKANDSTPYNYMNGLFARIGQAIGPEFAENYFDRIIPFMLKSSEITAATVIDADEPPPAQLNERTEKLTVVMMHVRGVGDKKLLLNTSLLEEKTFAMKMLFQFAKDSPVQFYPYVPAVSQIVIGLMRYPYNIDVRLSSTMIAPYLMRSIVGFVNKQGGVQSVSVDDRKNMNLLFDALFGALMQAILLEGEVEEQTGHVSVLARMLAAVYNSNGLFELSDIHLKELGEDLEIVINESLRRRRFFGPAGDDREVDDFEMTTYEDMLSTENELVSYCLDCIEYAYKVGKERFDIHFDQHLAKVAQEFLMDDSLNYTNDTPRIQGVCMLSDAIEFGSSENILAKYGPLFYRDVCASFLDKYGDNLDIVQCCVYGLGMLAKRNILPNAYENWLSIRAPRMIRSCDNREGEDDDEEQIKAKQMVRDNIVSLCGRILRYCQDDTGGDDAKKLERIETWVGLLPCNTDKDEMDFMVETLLIFVNQCGAALCSSREKVVGLLYLMCFYLSSVVENEEDYKVFMDLSIPTMEQGNEYRPAVNARLSQQLVEAIRVCSSKIPNGEWKGDVINQLQPQQQQVLAVLMEQNQL